MAKALYVCSGGHGWTGLACRKQLQQTSPLKLTLNPQHQKNLKGVSLVPPCHASTASYGNTELAFAFGRPVPPVDTTFFLPYVNL